MKLEYTKGDLIKLAEEGEFDVIVHGANCHNTMGSGIAKQIREKYPAAYNADCMTTAGDMDKLGTYTYALCGNFIIVNAYTQYNFNRGYDRQDLFEYTAFKLILEKLAKQNMSPTRFGFPLIGCGLAGGDKSRIIKLLEEFAESAGDGSTVTVVEFG